MLGAKLGIDRNFFSAVQNANQLLLNWENKYPLGVKEKACEPSTLFIFASLHS